MLLTASTMRYFNFPKSSPMVTLLFHGKRSKKYQAKKKISKLDAKNEIQHNFFM